MVFLFIPNLQLHPAASNEVRDPASWYAHCVENRKGGVPLEIFQLHGVPPLRGWVSCTYTIKNTSPIHGPGLTEQQCQVDPLEADWTVGVGYQTLLPVWCFERALLSMSCGHSRIRMAWKPNITSKHPKLMVTGGLSTLQSIDLSPNLTKTGRSYI